MQNHARHIELLKCVICRFSIIFHRRLDNAILKCNFLKSRNFIILGESFFQYHTTSYTVIIFNGSKKGKLISVTKRNSPFRNKIRNNIRKIQTGYKASLYLYKKGWSLHASLAMLSMLYMLTHRINHDDAQLNR